jgi:phosphonate transport system permease protein
MTASSNYSTALLGTRRLVVLAIAAAGVWAFAALGLFSPDSLPGSANLGVFVRFLAHALTPALVYEGQYVPVDAPSILVTALDAAWRTVVFASAAMSLSMVVGAVLGFLASTAWWAGADPGVSRGSVAATLRRTVAPVLYVTARTIIALMRSVHELLWAVVFLAAVGLSSLGAVIAIAIPYGGTLAKVFSEMVDEAPRDAADAMRASGAAPSQIFLFGLVTRALPDMGAYALYRFECALRSAAIVGFFGPDTLGKFIRQSWNENHYDEVWTYLYALFVLIAVVDWWSGAMRRRFIA